MNPFEQLEAQTAQTDLKLKQLSEVIAAHKAQLPQFRCGNAKQ